MKCPTCQREITHPKTHEQRKKFHKLCRLIGKEIGLTPGQVKYAVKVDHFGIDMFTLHGKTYAFVQSSEDTDRIEYSELVEAAYRWAAENGILIPDEPATRSPT